MEIFDYIRSTNLNDDNIDKGTENTKVNIYDQLKAGLYPGNRYTPGQWNVRDPNYSSWCRLRMVPLGDWAAGPAPTSFSLSLAAAPMETISPKAAMILISI